MSKGVQFQICQKLRALLFTPIVPNEVGGLNSQDNLPTDRVFDLHNHNQDKVNAPACKIQVSDPER